MSANKLARPPVAFGGNFDGAGGGAAALEAAGAAGGGAGVGATGALPPLPSSAAPVAAK